MATTNVDETAMVRPIPPRYWWLKRIMIGVGVLLILLLALRLWWGWEAHRRFRAEIDKLIAAGEPIFPEDFNPKEPIPDEQNAAKLYLEAFSKLELTEDDEEFLSETFLPSRNLSTDQIVRIRAIVEKNRESIGLVRRARALPTADWGYRFSAPVILTYGTAYVSEQRLLADFIGVVTAYHYLVDDPLEVVETLRDAFYFARATDRAPPVTDHLVAVANFSLQASYVEAYLPTAEVIRAARSGGRNGAALRESLEGHLAEMLDENTEQEAAYKHIQFEVMYLLDYVMVYGRTKLSWLDLPGATLSDKPPSLLKQIIAFPRVPLFWTEASRILNLRPHFLEAVGAPNAACASSIINAALIDPGPPKHFISDASWWESLNRALQLYFRGQAARRMAATALAIRLYEVDHGRRPETLDELVPDYLFAVPLDPLAEGDRPIGYLPDALHPMLYSVGLNGIDEGGKYSFHERGYIDTRLHDKPFFLDGPPETPAPSDDDSESDHDEAD